MQQRAFRRRGLGLVAFLVLPALGEGAAVPRGAAPGELVGRPDGQGYDESFALDPGLVPALLAVAPEAGLRVDDWPLAPAVRGAVWLARHEVYAPDARIVAIHDGREVEVPRSRLAFFWGSIEDDPGSTVVVGIDPVEKTASGFVLSRDGKFDLLPPSQERPGRHLLTPGSGAGGSTGQSFTCGQGRLEAADLGLRELGLGRDPGPRLPSSMHQAVLAVDTDNELMSIKFANANPATSITLATNWIAQAVAGMSAVYQRDLFVRLFQGYTILRLPSTADPYAQTGGGASGAKLNEFAAYWSANYGGIRRALALMISGKEPVHPVPGVVTASGIAAIAALCDAAQGYSFNQVFRTSTAITASEVELLTHEVGHNFGSRHTHCTDTNAVMAGTQPIDYCFAGETCSTGPWNPNQGTSCPAPFSITPVNNGGVPVTGVKGTIMSYCHVGNVCSAPAVTNVFHPVTVGVIGARIDAAIAGPGACIFPFAGNPPPTVSTILPTRGPTTGGTAVTITGTGFRSPASVAFADLASGRAATAVTVVNPTTITATTPAHTVGLKDVVVMNPDQQTGTLRNGYTYELAMTASSISPNAGSTAGGTAVTIQGASFTAPATVTLGGTPATGVNVQSSTTITATTPAHAAGIVSVVVQSNAQTATLNNGYFYFTPPPPARFYTVSPCRLVDTRNANGPRGGPALVASSRRNFTVTGVCGIPSTARSLSLNLTVTGPAAPGFVTLFPGNGIQPPTSNINFGVGQTRANNALVFLATDGSGSLAVLNGAAGTTHFILDVNGYYQ